MNIIYISKCVYTNANERFAGKSFNSGGSDEKIYDGRMCRRERRHLFVDCRREVFNMQRVCVWRVTVAGCGQGFEQSISNGSENN